MAVDGTMNHGSACADQLEIDGKSPDQKHEESAGLDLK
jgi:hypothetical protein